MLGDLETLAFFQVVTDEGEEKRVYAGDVLKAVRRAFPQENAEFFIVKKLTYASGGVIDYPDQQLVRGPAWPTDGSGDERVYNMMHGVDRESQLDAAEERLDAARAEVNRLRVPTLDELNDEEACRMMTDEEASEYLAAVK